MRFEIILVTLFVALASKKYDLCISLLLVLIVGIPKSKYTQFVNFISRLYLRYTYWCLNHSIKAVLAAKKELTKEHIDLIALRKWKEVLAWITFHPDELYLVDKKKQTVLHHCCLFRAPAVVIDMILYQAPDLVLKKNQDGEIPLNWAVRLSAPNEVLQLLLSADPASGCMSKDKYGNTALSIVWDRHSDEIFFKWWNEGRDNMIDDHWWKLIIYMFMRYYKSMIMPSRILDNSLSVIDEPEENIIQNLFWELHAATLCPGCPVSLFPVMIKVYNLQIRQKDHLGRIPLSIACLDPVSNRSSGVSTKIQLLLSEFPDGAQSPDNFRRIPIFSALESGITLKEGVSDLINAFPGCLHQFDPVTNLPPFLVAATAFQSSNDGKQEEVMDSSSQVAKATDVLRSLTTIYTILKNEPSSITRHETIRHRPK